MRVFFVWTHRRDAEPRRVTYGWRSRCCCSLSSQKKSGQRAVTVVFARFSQWVQLLNFLTYLRSVSQAYSTVLLTHHGWALSPQLPPFSIWGRFQRERRVYPEFADSKRKFIPPRVSILNWFVSRRNVSQKLLHQRHFSQKFGVNTTEMVFSSSSSPSVTVSILFGVNLRHNHNRYSTAQFGINFVSWVTLLLWDFQKLSAKRVALRWQEGRDVVCTFQDDWL